MAVAFRSIGALSSAAFGSITPALPTGWAENDIFLLFVEGGAAATAPSGWVEVTNSPQGVSTILNVFWRRATASESSPSVTRAFNHICAKIAAFSGCPTSGDPWDATAGTTNGGSTTATWSSVTTTVVNTLIVNALAWADDNAGPLSSTEANSNLTSLTERGDAGTTLGSGGGLVVITGDWASTGACGATTSTLSTTTAQSLLTIALKPLVATPGGAFVPPSYFAIPLLIR
jgi:hypothetical protein